jgi:hypothetical protein
MDQIRQIRLLIPPFFLFVSLLFGEHFAGMQPMEYLLQSKDLPTVVAIVGITVIPLGFLIGAISILWLWGFYFVIRRQHYETDAPKYCAKCMLQRLSISAEKASYFSAADLKFYSVITFDHELLDGPIHDWVTRRWSAFNTSMNCCTALFMAHGLGNFLGIAQTCPWWIFTILLVSVLQVSGWRAYLQTMRMVYFQSLRPPKTKVPPEPGTSGRE